MYTQDHRCSRRERLAFTRIDLLVINIMLGILVVIAFKAIAAGQIQNQEAVCMNNLRRLAQAWSLYAEDSNGTLVANFDGGGVTTLANSNRTWALGWLDFTGGTSFPPAYGGRS